MSTSATSHSPDEESFAVEDSAPAVLVQLCSLYSRYTYTCRCLREASPVGRFGLAVGATCTLFAGSKVGSHTVHVHSMLGGEV